MDLLSFMKEFPTEESCKRHFIEYRKTKGVICQKCECKAHYWLKKKSNFSVKNVDLGQLLEVALFYIQQNCHICIGI